jgi:hypothetical protein
MEKKCANLVNRSTTTYIQSLPWTFGNPVIKSIDMLSHFCSRMGNGCSNPADGSALTCYIDKSLTCFSTSSLRPFQVNLSPIFTPPLHPRNPAPSGFSMEASPEARFRISEARSGVQNGRFLMNLAGLLLYSSISLTTFVELYLGSDSMT